MTADAQQHSASNAASGPSPERLERARLMCDRMRAVLGPSFAVIPHGSMVTGTAVDDAARTDLVACWQDANSVPADWAALQQRIMWRLEEWELGSKVRLGESSMLIDIDEGVVLTPSLAQRGGLGSSNDEPLYVRPPLTALRCIHPRMHIAAIRSLDDDTFGMLTTMIRAFKRWNRTLPAATRASGFQIETLVHRLIKKSVNQYQDPEQQFAAERRLRTAVGQIDAKRDAIVTPAGDKDIFLEVEWSPARFRAWQAQLARASANW